MNRSGAILKYEEQDSAFNVEPMRCLTAGVHRSILTLPDVTDAEEIFRPAPRMLQFAK
jgi:hypothetical protein